MIRIIVLGSGAGGGFPQWNCVCENCLGVRAGRPGLRARTQASLAVSADGEQWLLLGASPDLRAQLAATPALWPREGARAAEASRLHAVALPNGDVDAWIGLLSMREWSGFEVWATSRVRRDLVDRNEVLQTLDRRPGLVRWRELVPGEPRSFASGRLSVEAVPVPGVAPLHLRGSRPTDPLDNVGLVLRDRHGGGSVGWFPTVGAPSEALARALGRVEVLFFDGTFWSDDELTLAGRGEPGGASRARDMGHWPLSGPEGSLELLASLPAREKWLVHVNNTNPVLLEEGEQRARVRAHKIDVAFDGLELLA